VYGIIHVANAVGHITVSIAGRWVAPGVYSSPLLLASALWLLSETDGVRRRAASTGPPGLVLSNP
jgi:hypothetical protein